MITYVFYFSFSSFPQLVFPLNLFPLFLFFRSLLSLSFVSLLSSFMILTIVTDGNIYQLLLKSATMTFYPFKMSIVQPPSPMMTVYQACISIPAVRDSSLIHYGNAAGQLTKSSLHHQQALSANLGRRGHATTSGTTLQTSQQPSRSKGNQTTTCLQIQWSLEGHVYDQKA